MFTQLVSGGLHLNPAPQSQAWALFLKATLQGGFSPSLTQHERGMRVGGGRRGLRDMGAEET